MIGHKCPRSSAIPSRTGVRHEISRTCAAGALASQRLEAHARAAAANRVRPAHNHTVRRAAAPLPDVAAGTGSAPRERPPFTARHRSTTHRPPPGPDGPTPGAVPPVNKNLASLERALDRGLTSTEYLVVIRKITRTRDPRAIAVLASRLDSPGPIGAAAVRGLQSFSPLAGRIWTMKTRSPRAADAANDSAPPEIADEPRL